MLTKASIAAIRAIADAIRELGEVPSGHLYATVMDSVTAEEWQNIVNVLKEAGVVRESNHLLTWIGPPLSQS